jgi:aminobenzoyl-glutamate utilization protein A
MKQTGKPGSCTWDLVSLRRDFHRFPEPGFGEFRTAGIVSDFLRRRGFRVKIADEAMNMAAIHHRDEGRVAESAERAAAGGTDKGLIELMLGGGTAVVADIGPMSGPVVAFRFDMDALPIQESSDRSHPPEAQGFASANPGLMHACGHDGHLAIGLGLAAMLAERGDSLKATVRLIFQPAEEGTMGGAEAIVDRGSMTDVRYMVCCHLGLGLPTGTIACRSGFLATSKYAVDFLGVESHASNEPQSGKNALLAAAAASLALHGIGAHSDGWLSVNVGVLRAGESQVIIPGKATIELGYWADKNEIHDYVTDRVRQVVNGSAESWGVVAEQRLIGRAPIAPLSGTLAKVIKGCAEGMPELIEARDWVESRVAEDGNVFLAEVARTGGHGAFVIIGSDIKGGHHTPSFDIDERSLELGVSLLSKVCLQLLDDCSGEQ